MRKEGIENKGAEIGKEGAEMGKEGDEGERWRQRG